MTEVLTRALRDPADWLGSEMIQRSDWVLELDAAELDEVERALAGLAGRRPVEIRRDDFPLPTLAKRLDGILGELEGGRGFCLLRGLPAERWSEDEARLALWGLGTYLGTAEKQDGAGNLLHSVRNTGQLIDTTDNVRPYETNEEIQFHNDGADIFMLMCYRTAKSGGVSKLVSSVAVFNEIVRTRPDLAEVLQKPFYFDTRSQRPDGVRVQAVPIFSYHRGKLNVLYKRRFIDTAQRFPEVPRLTPLQIEAIDCLDRLCADPKFCMTFSLRPGDVEIASNYATLHARTHFEDHPEIDKRRHMFRVWLTIPNGRVLPPIFEDTREFRAVFERRRESATGTPELVAQP
jgi:hypothetical protein